MGILDSLIKAGSKTYNEGAKRKAADEPAFIPSLGKGNSMPTPPGGQIKPALPPITKPPAAKPKADPNDMGRVMDAMGMGAGKASKTLNTRKK